MVRIVRMAVFGRVILTAFFAACACAADTPSQIDGGVPSTLIKLVGRQPFRNAADYEAWPRRAQRFPRYLDGVADVLRDGIASNITVPRVIVERTLTQLESLAPDMNDIAKSAPWKPVLRFPANMDAESRARFTTHCWPQDICR